MSEPTRSQIKNAVDDLDKVVDNLTEQINAIETLLAAQAVVIKDTKKDLEELMLRKKHQVNEKVKK